MDRLRRFVLSIWLMSAAAFSFRRKSGGRRAKDFIMQKQSQVSTLLHAPAELATRTTHRRRSRLDDDYDDLASERWRPLAALTLRSGGNTACSSNWSKKYERNIKASSDWNVEYLTKSRTRPASRFIREPPRRTNPPRRAIKNRLQGPANLRGHASTTS